MILTEQEIIGALEPAIKLIETHILLDIATEKTRVLDLLKAYHQMQKEQGESTVLTESIIKCNPCIIIELAKKELSVRASGQSH